MTPEDSAARHYAFGPYEILDTLGHGGMGVVYRAHDRNLGRTVALKILRDELRGESQVAARFQREAEAFARLDHPNIVHVYSVGTVEKIPYIAMEYVEGETLADRMRREGGLSWRDVLGYGAQIARALASAHEAQIIHRDIKPGNILIETSGRVRVTDFGIAKILNASTQLTTDGSRLGTPQYMCPERCRNLKVTPSSDLYSLGVVLFQAIAGRLPYDARSNVELVREISKGEPRRLREFVPEAPDAVERLLAYMMEKTPEQRPAGAAVLAESIGRVLEGGTVDEHAEELVQRLDAYRRALPDAVTPDPDTPTRAVERTSMRRRLRRAWYARTRGERIGFAVIVAIALISAAGLVVHDWATQPRSLAASVHVDEANRWERSASLIDLRPETEHVTIAEISLPDFGASAAQWSEAQQLLVLLTGTKEREGQVALIELDPATGATALVVPPFHGAEQVRPAVLSSAPGAVLLGLGGGLRELTPGLRNPGEPLAGRRLLSADTAAVSEIMTVADREYRAVAHLDAQYNAWRVSAIDADDYRLGEPWTAPGSVITALSVSAAGDSIAYVRVREVGPEGGAELWWSDRNSETLLDAGRVSLAAAGLAAGGTLYTREDTDGARVYWYPADAAEARVLWAGAWPQWVTAEQLVYHGEDRLGRTQLFIGAANRALDVQPLTHLDGGVAASGATLSRDRRRAVVPLADGGRIAIVDIGGAASI